MRANGWLGALAGLGVVIAMLAALEFVLRLNTWMRQHGLGRLVTGTRETDVAMKWIFRILLAALGLFFLVLFFERV